MCVRPVHVGRVCLSHVVCGVIEMVYGLLFVERGSVWCTQLVQAAQSRRDDSFRGTSTPDGYSYSYSSSRAGSRCYDGNPASAAFSPSASRCAPLQIFSPPPTPGQHWL